MAFVPWAVPRPGRIAAGIEIDVTVGFGEEPEDVPGSWKVVVWDKVLGLGATAALRGEMGQWAC